MTDERTRPGRFSEAEKGEMQGFATSGYGHLPHVAYLFLTLANGDAAREWLRWLLPHLTTARGRRPRPGEPKARPRRTANVALSYPGLAALGLSKTALCTFPRAFVEGMAEPARAARILGDVGSSHPDRWHFGGPSSEPVHLCLLLHAASPDEGDAWVAEHREAMARTKGGVALVPHGLQTGHRRPDGKEPFGFRDGIAQPRIVGIGGEGAPGALPTGEFILGYRDHYGQIAARPALPADEDPSRLLPEGTNPFHPRGAWRDLARNGTYLVHRRLEQDVRGFWAFVREEARRMRAAGVPGFDDEDEGKGAIRLASAMMGRWPGGAPLALSPGSDDPALAREDGFGYAREDPHGHRCPFAAHIRKVNPRDQLRPTRPAQSLNLSNAHRIRRQGSVIGSGRDGEPSGIHFVALQADLARQFELIQQQWMNNPAFNGTRGSADPVASGQGGGEHRFDIPLPRGSWRTDPLPSFVTMTGGGYFFLPSMAVLRLLAARQPPPP